MDDCNVPNCRPRHIGNRTPRHTEPANISIQSINWQQLESGDGDDVGCTCDIESLGHFGIDVTVDTGKERDQQRCFRLKNVTYRYSVVANLEAGYEKPNSQHLIAKLELAFPDPRTQIQTPGWPYVAKEPTCAENLLASLAEKPNTISS